MATGDEAAVKAVFSRCLLTCLSVDLWRAYLNFIKRVRLYASREVPCGVRMASGGAMGDMPDAELGMAAGSVVSPPPAPSLNNVALLATPSPRS